MKCESKLFLAGALQFVAIGHTHSTVVHFSETCESRSSHT